MRTIAAFAGVGVAALLCLAGPARAQEGIFMKELLGSLGVIPEDKPRIEYRERAPLVLPPKASLPAPIAKPAEARNANWPKDPDVLAEKRREARARLPAGTDERSRMLREENVTLSVDEIRQGRRAGAGIPAEPELRPNLDHRDAVWMHPDVLRGQRMNGGDTDNAPLVAGVEPRRKALTEPPTGFRAPSAKAKIRNDFEPSGFAERRDDADPVGFVRQQNGR
ncbi:MAG TPA: hypothetical protein VKA39_09315 [Beijerinckiaceae bacterium]|jgi:hypothetical protein|nr:hypothetical protein [Beijerinckiaceae bacterium]